MRAYVRRSRRNSMMVSALVGRIAPGRGRRARGGIGQARLALGQKPAQPFVHRRRRYPLYMGGLIDTALFGNELLGHFQSTRKGQSGMLMGVHPPGLLRILGVVVTSSFSNPVRMNHAYNLLNLYT